MTHHSDTDVFDDLRHIAGLALSRAGKTGPVREGLQRRIDRLEAWVKEAEERRSELPMERADQKPFEPMACCGRERDKDGGPNPHCECPAELKPKPVAPDSPKCWRCDGEPHEHTRLKPRRPVCAECVLELIFSALALDEPEEITQ